MRNLARVFESMVKSYNEGNSINFVDLRDLDAQLIDNRDLVEKFIGTFNRMEKINFFDLKELETLIK